MKYIESLLTGSQSALDPAGTQAAAIARLTWIMFAGGGVIFVLVMTFLAVALAGPLRYRAWLADRRSILIGGIAFPVVVLSALLIYGLSLARTITASPADALQIHVVGEQFWWRVRYSLTDGGTVETANEIHVPIDQPIELSLTTADVIHSLWIPTFGGKLDMIPGQTNRLVFRASKPGVYRGQCTEFCGSAHALMAFDVVAHTPDSFATWLAALRQPAQEPMLPFTQRGKELFVSSGCGSCHAVRGTVAAGVLGPELTHLGSRRSLGAASFPNNAGTLAGWIVDAQHLKPGNRMPSFNVFKGEDLRAIAQYLESLK